MKPTKEQIENARDDLATRPAKAGIFRSTHRLCLAGLDALEREARVRDALAPCTCMCPYARKAKALLGLPVGLASLRTTEGA